MAPRGSPLRAGLVVRAENFEASGALLGEVRMLEDRLGLSPMAMLRLRWEVVEEEPEHGPKPLTGIRRLQAVDPSDRRNG